MSAFDRAVNIFPNDCRGNDQPTNQQDETDLRIANQLMDYFDKKKKDAKGTTVTLSYFEISLETGIPQRTVQRLVDTVNGPSNGITF